MVASAARLFLKRLFFPGMDLGTRLRYRVLPRFFIRGDVATLDAGCGNGALSYAAYRLGNRVLGISNDTDQISRARTLFHSMQIPEARASFEVCNLYDLARLNQGFDQIICSETLEHIREDVRVIRLFHDVLRPGGRLHLCAPYALHPEHALGRVDGPEDGGHVRDGYTMESYRALLEPNGFEIVEAHGIASAPAQKAAGLVRRVRNRFGDAAAVPVFLLCWPLYRMDRLDPAVPYSLYVLARRTTPA